jgi:anti-sigma factor RsiW
MMEENSSAPQDHIDDDQLDGYVLGHLEDKEQIATVEQHLLLCEYCQERLEHIDLLRKALRHLHNPKEPDS